MNVLHNQIATLYTLWSSLHVDSLTMNKKLNVTLTIYHSRMETHLSILSSP
jgi:hypothetical protein